MYVDKVVLPDMGDPREWDAEFTITFRAYNVPFWQDGTPTTVTDTLVAGTEKTKTITAPGNTKTQLDISFTNTSGSSMSTFSVTIGGKTMSLTDLALANGETLVITHGDDGRLRITEGTRNAYGKQTAGGLDDLILDPGGNTVKVTAGKAGNLSMSCCGRYI